MLKSDPAVFDLYCEYAKLDAGLQHLVSGPAGLGSEQSAIADLARTRRIRRANVIAVLTAAAAIVLLTSLLRLIWITETPPTLTFRTGPEARFVVEHDANLKKTPAPNTLEPGSRLRLEYGAIEFNFSSGVRSIIEAPSELMVLTEDLVSMKEGKAWFHVPEAAVGFRVMTPEMTVTDLGTEFGIISKKDERPEVHVFTGKVEVLAHGGAAMREVLKAGRARALTAGALDSITSRPDRFLRSLPTRPASYLHWTFDEGDPGRQFVRGNSAALQGLTSECSSLDGTEPFASFSVVPGKFGNALSSFGRGGYVRTSFPGLAQDTPYTLSYWLKLPRGQHSIYTMVAWGEPDPQTGHRAFSTSVRKASHGSVAGITFGEADFEGSTPLDDAQWHHLAIVSTGHRFANGDPEFTCYIDGKEEAMTRRSHSHGVFPRDDQQTGPSAKELPSSLTIFDHPWAHERTGQDVVLALVRENGLTSAYLDGVRIGTNTATHAETPVLSHLMIGANREEKGELEGFFTGSIDRIRLSPFTGFLGSNNLLGSHGAHLEVVADYSFDDHKTPDGFREIGDPTYENGRLILDGDDALECLDTPLKATDNFVIEAVVRMDELPSNARKFTLPVTNSNGRNRGWGIIYQYTWGGIIMGGGPVGSATDLHRQEVTVAIDELQLFESALGAHQIQALHQFNSAATPLNKQ